MIRGASSSAVCRFGAPQFLRSIAEELIPFVERGYRVEPQRRAIWSGSYVSLVRLFGTPQPER